MNKYQKEFFKLIEEERKRQNQLFGEQEHDDFIWSAILVGEVGDLHKTLLKDYNDPDGLIHSDEIIKELVHIGAVLENMFEALKKQIGE